MEQSQDVSSLDERVGYLERRLKIWRVFGGLSLLVLVFAACAALFMRPAKADESEKVLHLRGLVIEDAQGRPRILLGAPIPKVSGRKRQDADTGIVLVGENGADRVAIGAPTPAPQVGGKVRQRISPGAGFVVSDLDGNERGGIGVLDNGRGVICLDYPDPIGREAICLGVIPEIGLAGLTINAPTGANGERAEMAVLKNGTSLMKLADPNGDERTMLLVPGDAPAQFLVLDPKTRSKVDVLKKFNP